ncbi:TMEM175 family protein [Aquabacter sp. CN5-332]|uniref:TMEM175 family protein n=1 Tax=Aquabacter sp. CN5-332 TaxID=3156608 RepID=UPI0032B5F9CE
MSRFPKARVDALTDGIFAFAMTLLVLDVRLPADLPIASAGELTAHLLSLGPQIFTYLISFFVLGAQWRASIELRPAGERLTGGVVSLWLMYLFFVTTVPFSSSVVGKYGAFPPAVYVYSANMIALGVLVIALRHLEVPEGKRSLARAAGSHLPLFIIAALASMVVSVFEPRYAMFAYLLNFLPHLPGWPKPREERSPLVGQENRLD